MDVLDGSSHCDTTCDVFLQRNKTISSASWNVVSTGILAIDLLHTVLNFGLKERWCIDFKGETIGLTMFL
jgi:hypothetical protein